MMNFSYRVPLAPVCLAFFEILCLFGTGSHAQDFKPVRQGVEHAIDTRVLTDNEPVKINLLRLDLSKVRLDVHHALDRSVGLETTSAIAKRKGAVAAINAGFFRLDNSQFAGEAAGILMIDGSLLSESANDRSSLGILNHKKRTEVKLGRLRSRLIVAFGTDSQFGFDGINRERKPNEIILFTPEFYPSTKTFSDGTEIVLTNCTIEGSRWLCRNAQVYKDQGNASIPRDGLVISIGKEALERSNNIVSFAERARAKAGDFDDSFRVIQTVEAIEPLGKTIPFEAEDIANGVPQLIRNGKIDITWDQERASRSFVESRHPRTAVAKLKDGKFLMITVDGRQPGVSAGMSLKELADYLLTLGAVDALNLDGGGSTTMFLNGRVVNQPSDKTGERKVGDAILVTFRERNKN